MPLVIPIRGACPCCGGRGESWAEPCLHCAGSGEALFHHTVNVAVPPGVSDGATFRFRVTSPHTGSVRVNIRIAIQPSLV
jgi:molecular chaperone DnaJ